MKKQTTIFGFYKRKHTSSSQNPENPSEIVLDENASPSTIPASSPIPAPPTIPASSPIPVPSPIPAPSTIPVGESQPKKTRIEMNEIDLNTIERDPGLRTQIYDYPVNQRDVVRRAYINLGPLQTTLSVYPKSGPESHKRSFQECWFNLYPWLEYSKTLDAAFCFPCFLFNKPLGPGYYGQRAFTIDGMICFLMLSLFVWIATSMSLICLLLTLVEVLELVRSTAIIHSNIIIMWIFFMKQLIAS